MFVLKEFEFDAAHYLPEYNGKCERLHGHTYKLVDYHAFLIRSSLYFHD